MRRVNIDHYHYYYNKYQNCIFNASFTLIFNIISFKQFKLANNFSFE